MSVLPGDVLQSLAQLLQGLQSSDNSVRSQAEESLSNDWVASRPEILLMGLAELLGSSQETIVRLLNCGNLGKDLANMSILSFDPFPLSYSGESQHDHGKTTTATVHRTYSSHYRHPKKRLSGRDYSKDY